MDITNLSINDIANSLDTSGVYESKTLLEEIKELTTLKLKADKQRKRFQVRIAELEEVLDEIKLWTDDQCAIEAIDEVMGIEPDPDQERQHALDIKAEHEGDIMRERRLGL